MTHPAPGTPELVVFDLDGTLIDSDAPLDAAWVTNGVDPARLEKGMPVGHACRETGISLGAYADAYDTGVARPFPGVVEMLAAVPRWAVLSNKHPDSALAELARLGWEPEVTLCADAFDWDHKSLRPLVEVLALDPARVAMVGDSAGDLRCATEVGCRFVWAGWNERVRAAGPGGLVAATPEALLGVLGLR